ncbi:hypothetical protein C8R43DRAFT_910598, partial [Mycena crocata]
PIIDADRRVIAVLGGHPRDPAWIEDVAQPAAAHMQAAAAEIYSKPRWRRRALGTIPRRGPHHAKNVGPSMGGGQRWPMNLAHSTVNLIIFAQLFAFSEFRRIAGWTNVLFMAFAPALHTFYQATSAAVFDWDRRARKGAKRMMRNFRARDSVFTTATFKFGRRTATFPHIDFGNLAWGWCAITALGCFDPDKGGHLILWDLMLIIRFPPGTTILIPSAILRHSNVPVGSKETRFSFTQYTPAGIFRWVYNDFRTDADVEQNMCTNEQDQRREDRANRWREGIHMYRTWP